MTVPEQQCRSLKAIAGMVTYGWGMIPVRVCIGSTTYQTSLWPKDGSYIVPIKASIRRAEAIYEGDTVSVQIEVG